MRQLPVVILLCLLSQVASSQHADTTRMVPESWRHYFPGIRLAAGWQKAFYYEAGLSLQKFTFGPHHHYTAGCFYASYLRSRAMDKGKPVQGIKAGAELVNTGGGTGGIEVTYLTNSIEEDVVVTPKFGLGIGAATVFYGYNISSNKYPFVNIGRHQLSLAVNTNILFYQWKHGN